MTRDRYSRDRLNHEGPYKHHVNVPRGDGATLGEMALQFGEDSVRVDAARVPSELDSRQLILADGVSHLVGVYIRSERFNAVSGPNDRPEYYLQSPPNLPIYTSDESL